MPEAREADLGGRELATGAARSGRPRTDSRSSRGSTPVEPGTPARPKHEPRAQRELNFREYTYRRALALSDVLATAAALALAGGLAGVDLTPQAVLVLPLGIMVSKLLGLYDRDDLLIRKTTIDEAPKLLQVATIVTLVLWLGAPYLLGSPLFRAPALVLLGALFGLSVLSRRAARAIVGRFVATERCLFVGDAEAYERLRTKFVTTGVNAVLVARMSSGRTTRHTREQELRDLVTWARVHRVIIEPQAFPPDEALEFVRTAKQIGVRVSLLPRVLDVVGSSVVFDDLAGVTILGVKRFGLTPSSRVLKRAFDLVAGTLALIWAVPVMAAIAIAIRLDSPGPVFFRQERVGRDGTQFRMLKFRTMVTGAEALKDGLRSVNEAEGGLFKIADDPRVTRVGRYLRRTSLDELPQLFNVLLGSMSLVGPRPLVIDEGKLITGWNRRLELKPGMTGQWQIAGSSRVPMPEMVKIDYLYAGGWSLWEDVKILLRTVPYMLSRRGL